MTEAALLLAFAAALGAIVGSFANVCIHRLPRGESVVSPPSRCPGCGGRIAFYDNVPVVSWLLLRGRCRRCAMPIPVRYPLVETATALLFLGAAIFWGPTTDALRGAFLGAACIVLVATDLSDRILPDEVTLGGALLGLLLSALPERPGDGSLAASGDRVLESLLGAAVGSGLLLAVRAAYRRFRGVEGLGLGDVKMLAMVGAFTGPAGALLTVFLGSLAGSVLGGAFTGLRSAAWRQVARGIASGAVAPDEAARTGGLLVAPDGRVLASSPLWREIPGAAAEGEPLRSSSAVARPLVAFARLARRRAGRPSSASRLVVDDGDEFFRVFAARGVPAGDGALLVLFGRADIPFGVFLAAGALVAFAAGRALLEGSGLSLLLPQGLLP